MKHSDFKEIVERAEKDPEFLHKLVFKTEALIDELKPKIGRAGIGALIGKEPGEIIAKTIGIAAGCGNTCTSSCGNTCGQSCGYTTNLVGPEIEAATSYFSRNRGELAACGNTCTSSCGNTCGGSCNFTTNLTGPEFGGFAGGWQTFR